MESGILEGYVLGIISTEERKEVERLMESQEEIRLEVYRISQEIEAFALKQAVAPDVTIKPSLMGIIDYDTRIVGGEAVTNPPVLHTKSKIEDYADWLNRKDMVLPPNFDDEIYLKIIGHSAEKMTGILWLRSGAPPETHETELEKFLIVEGACDITIGDKVHSLVAGDFLEIPLFIEHNVKVTSSILCKVILERFSVAA